MKNHLLFFAVALFLIFAMVACNKEKEKEKEKNVTGVTIEPEILTLYIEETATLTATVLPADATNQAVGWTSSHPEVATVSDGLVTAKSAGTTTITVTTLEGSFTAKCEVAVIQTEPEELGIVINGVKWATRNLAAHGKFVENPEDYGALFQWGRKGDGHEQRTSPNYPTNDNSFENGVVSGSGLNANGQIVSTHAAYGKFIKQIENPYDWCFPQNDALWNSDTETNPVKTANDPCPDGWRVPTQAELQNLQNSGSIWWSELNGVRGRYFGNGANRLFLPFAGYRDFENGEVLVGIVFCEETGGRYWSSSVDGIYAWVLGCGIEDGGIGCTIRPYGYSVRCVADN